VKYEKKVTHGFIANLSPTNEVWYCFWQNLSVCNAVIFERLDLEIFFRQII